MEMEEWAYQILDTKQPVYILDTETTGLGETAEIVELALIDRQGKALINSLFKPSKPIPYHVTEIHGITNKDCENAPFFFEKYYDLIGFLKGSILLIYNANFDIRIIHQTIEPHSLMPLPFATFDYYCVMEKYAAYYGDWSNYHQSFKWQSLSNAASQCGISISNAHRAYGDCLTVLKVLQVLASRYEQSKQQALEL